MDRIDVLTKQSVNGISFGTAKELTRKLFGSDYENSLEDKANPDDVKLAKFLIAQKFRELYTAMGMPGKELTWPDTSMYQSDIDRYSDFDVEYNKKNGEFVSFTLYAVDNCFFVVDGVPFVDFKVQGLLKLADDFEWEPLHTSYTSKSKQISIYCPKGKNKVESIIFGCEGYYDEPGEEAQPPDAILR